MPDSVFMGVPGGNPSGMQTQAPLTTVGSTPAPVIGSTSANPLVPSFPAGNSAPPINFPANTGGTDPNSLIAALSGMFPGGAQWPGYAAGQVATGFNHAGYPNAIAGMLASFLQQGAGFNPQAIAGLLAALQPQISRGSANIMEQFGAQGLASSSPAAIGLGDFLSQATLDEGQIISQMYEQSVQNYMDVLLAGRKNPSQQGGIGALIGGAGSAAGGIMQGAAALAAV